MNRRQLWQQDTTEEAPQASERSNRARSLRSPSRQDAPVPSEEVQVDEVFDDPEGRPNHAAVGRASDRRGPSGSSIGRSHARRRP